VTSVNLAYHSRSRLKVYSPVRLLKQGRFARLLSWLLLVIEQRSIRYGFNIRSDWLLTEPNIERPHDRRLTRRPIGD
jgi:hypothetical protein